MLREVFHFFVQVVADNEKCGNRKARRIYAFVGRRDSLGTFHGMHTIYRPRQCHHQQRLGDRMAHLSLAVGPEVDGDADHIVYRGVGALVQQDGDEHAERVDGQAGADAAVEGRAGDKQRQRPLPRQSQQAEQDVEYLQHGKRPHGAVQGSVLALASAILSLSAIFFRVQGTVATYLVKMSQKILGQKMPCTPAAIWYVAAERMMSRARWFLMSLPIVYGGGGGGGCDWPLLRRSSRT